MINEPLNGAQGSEDIYQWDFAELPSKNERDWDTADKKMVEINDVMNAVWFLKIHYSKNARGENTSDPVREKKLDIGGKHDVLEIVTTMLPNTEKHASYNDNMHLPSNAVDCALQSYWQANPADTKGWLMIDLGFPHEISRFFYYNPCGNIEGFADDSECSPAKCSLQYSAVADAPDSMWCTAHEWTGSKRRGMSEQMEFGSCVGQYWKMVIESTHGQPGPKVGLMMFYGTRDQCSELNQYSKMTTEEKKLHFESLCSDQEIWNQPAELYNTLDFNHDGKISSSEFQDWYNYSNFRTRLLKAPMLATPSLAAVGADGEDADAETDQLESAAPCFGILPPWYENVKLDPRDETQHAPAGYKDTPSCPHKVGMGGSSQGSCCTPACADAAACAEKVKQKEECECLVARSIRDDNQDLIEKHFTSVYEEEKNVHAQHKQRCKTHSTKLGIVAEGIEMLIRKRESELTEEVQLTVQKITKARTSLTDHGCPLYVDTPKLERYNESMLEYVSLLGGASPPEDSALLDEELEAVKTHREGYENEIQQLKSHGPTPPCTAYVNYEIASLVHKSVSSSFWKENKEYQSQVVMPPGMKLSDGRPYLLPASDISFYLREEHFELVLEAIKVMMLLHCCSSSS